MPERCQECGARLGAIGYVKEVEIVDRRGDDYVETRVIERVVCLDCLARGMDDATIDA